MQWGGPVSLPGGYHTQISSAVRATGIGSDRAMVMGLPICANAVTGSGWRGELNGYNPVDSKPLKLAQAAGMEASKRLSSDGAGIPKCLQHASTSGLCSAVSRERWNVYQIRTAESAPEDLLIDVVE